MLQDTEQKRRPTEIDYLNGYIVRKGIEMGIPTPANQIIYDTILRLQQEY
jgi:2-dehydropantoate 2-reductase